MNPKIRSNPGVCVHTASKSSSGRYGVPGIIEDLQNVVHILHLWCQVGLSYNTPWIRVEGWHIHHRNANAYRCRRRIPGMLRGGGSRTGLETPRTSASPGRKRGAIKFEQTRSRPLTYTPDVLDTWVYFLARFKYTFLFFYPIYQLGPSYLSCPLYFVAQTRSHISV